MDALFDEITALLKGLMEDQQRLPAPLAMQSKLREIMDKYEFAKVRSALSNLCQRPNEQAEHFAWQQKWANELAKE